MDEKNFADKFIEVIRDVLEAEKFFPLNAATVFS